jgi:nitroimidazol reductase NimA-like FMN-containing flavoprotein (pyridoxamine 5'-phosphate oxidase superfamily)
MNHDFDIDEFLTQPLMAHLATMSQSGARESPVWFLWEDSNVWLVGNSRDSFPRRLRQNPRCAIGIVEFNLESGVLRHVGIRGIAEVVPLEDERLHRLLKRYLGDDETHWDSRFREEVIDRLDLMVRVVPESVVARDQSYYKQRR